MNRPRHIQRDGYHALDWRDDPGLCITDLWRQFPELVVGRYLVNTSFDSGFLMLSDSDRQQGWRMVGSLAQSPKIRSADQIPHDQYDEWLVFEHPVEIEGFETMVNYSEFSPIDFDWDEKLERFKKYCSRFGARIFGFWRGFGEGAGLQNPVTEPK